MRLCGYLTVTVDAGLFVCLSVPEIVQCFTEAFAHCRINLCNQSHLVTYLCGAEGVVLILYLINNNNYGWCESV